MNIWNSLPVQIVSTQHVPDNIWYVLPTKHYLVGNTAARDPCRYHLATSIENVGVYCAIVCHSEGHRVICVVTLGVVPYHHTYSIITTHSHSPSLPSWVIKRHTKVDYVTPCSGPTTKTSASSSSSAAAAAAGVHVKTVILELGNIQKIQELHRINSVLILSLRLDYPRELQKI